MYSTPIGLSFSYLRSAVEASLDIKKVQMEPNTLYVPCNTKTFQFSSELPA